MIKLEMLLFINLYEVLFHLFKNNVLTQFWRVFFKFKTVRVVTFVFLSQVQTFARFFVFKSNIYAHLSLSFLLFCNFFTFVISFEGYTVAAAVITSCFIK